MEGIIGTDGTIREVQVVSSPHPDLERAALDAVRQWQFDTTLLNCQPVEVNITVRANFEVQP
jgi:TonB family protein